MDFFFRFSVCVCVLSEEKKRKKKKILTGNLVSTLKRRYGTLMRMMCVFHSTSCRILICRLDRMLGPSLMNLERNWSHCWWMIVGCDVFLVFERRKTYCAVYSMLLPRDSTISISPVEWEWVKWPEGCEEVWFIPLNGHGPYTFFVGSIHNAGHNFSLDR